MFLKDQLNKIAIKRGIFHQDMAPNKHFDLPNKSSFQDIKIIK